MPKRDTAAQKRRASFIEPMLLKRSAELPKDDAWLIELKLDGFRAIAFKTGGEVHLRSRNDKDFNGRYPAIVKGLCRIRASDRRFGSYPVGVIGAAPSPASSSRQYNLTK
jgi:ATP-dependent DNA ligase